MSKRFAMLGLAMLCSIVLVSCGGGDDDGNGNGSGDGTGQGTGTLYIFGDSLSDTGNVGRAASFGEDLPAPYYQNRISNGPVIVDYVAQSLSQELSASDYRSSQERGTNYAVAGARAKSDGIDLDLDAQVTSFLTKNDFRADSNDIYLFFIGGNDILDVSDAGTQATAPLDDAAQEVASNMRRLALLGARRFIVLNAPDIGKTPKVIERDQQLGGGIAAAATASTNYYNNKLSDELAANRAIGVNSDLIDVQLIVDNIIANGSGFTNSTQGCYIREQFRFASYCSAEQLDAFVFFDNVHPSGRMHQLVGEQVAQQVGSILN